MALSGTLRTLSLAEIFQTLARSQATGVLRLMTSEGVGDVVFDDGAIIHLNDRSPHKSVTLVARLQAMGAMI